MHAESFSIRPLLTLITVLLLTTPAFLSAPSSGGSVFVDGPEGFQDGTVLEAAATDEGLRLARDETLIGNWTRMDGWPTPRYYHGMAYDNASGVSVMFGGFDGQRCLDDTWTFDSVQNTWTRMSQSQSPPARQSPAMAFDRQSGLVVLFGGDDGSTGLTDTWTYSTAADKWTRMNPATAPAAQMSESYKMAYSAQDGVMVLFGGPDKTWTYSVGTNTWTQMTPATSPPGRQYHSLAYDSARKVVVLFGGAYGGIALSDTWTYSVAQNLWTNVTPATSPRARYGHGMAYDRTADRMVLFSGYDEYGLILNDTWAFDPGTPAWTDKKPASFPYPRCYYGMAYDEAAGETVLFSGASFSWRSEDTWTYNASSDEWVRKTPAPSERIFPSFAYDDSAGVAVLFGGNDLSSHFCDTWTYDYRANLWTEQGPSTAPQARTGGALVYDGKDGLSVLFGGRWGTAAWQTLGDTWTYDVSANAWTEMKPATAPTARAFHAMACDPESGLAVLYGGWGEFGITNDTWVYNLSANTWTQMYPATSPPARQEPAMAFDTESGLFVLFGGVAATDLKDTWTYNVSSNVWTKKSPGKSPTARLASMTCDGANGQLVLAGGCTSDLTKVFNETWTYEVSADKWTERNPLPWASGRARLGLAGDSQNGVIILFGGGYDGYHGDTWVYSLNRYAPLGGFFSQPVDLGGPAAFSRIEWTATVPDTTFLVFQFRAAGTYEELELADYVGPDGTTDTFYSESGETIYSGHNGSRWMQYLAGFNTTVPADTPLLKEVRIIYNLPPEVSITAPIGNENWSGDQNITWEASDPDGDGLTFDLYLINENATSGTSLALNLTNTTSYRWNTTTVENGAYYIHIIARDNDTDIPLSGNYTSPLFNISNKHANRPPVALLLSPTEGQVIDTTTVKLEWSGSDPDGDALTYFVYLAQSPIDPQNPPQPAAATPDTKYTAFGLKKGTTYRWTVMASDGKVNSTIAEVRSFTIMANRPPVIELLEPLDGITINTSQAALTWNGSDPDLDRLTYFVIVAPHDFTPSSLPPPYAKTYATSYPVSDLLNGSTYYWTVVPFDGETNGTGLQVRRFTVRVDVPVTAPRVIDFAPKNTSVSVKPTVVVTFDRDMNATTVYDALMFEPPLNTTGFVHINTTIQVSLGAELSHNITYEVTVRTTARSLDGYYLASPFYWNFSTVAEGEKDTDLPVVSLTDPAPGASRVGQYANITIMFSESMNRTATERAVSFDPFVNVNWSWIDQKGFGMRFWLKSPMPNGTIRITILPAARDESGNPLDGNGNGIADGAGDNYTLEFRVGLIVPMLIYKGPEGKGIALNASIRLTFDRAMNLSSLESAITIRPAIKGNWTADAALKVFTFAPAGKLRAGTKYTVTVAPSAQDLEGYLLMNGTVWTFSTLAAPVRQAEFPWLLMAILLIVIVVAAVAGVMYMRRTKKPDFEDVEPAEKPAEAVASTGALAGAQGEGAAAPQPAAQPAFALPAAPAPFAVEDVFLLYRDGRLMMHIGQSAGEARFPEVLGTVQELFKKVPEKRDEDAPPVTMQHAGKKVLFERGKWTAMAAVTTGPESESFREEMLSQVRNVEAEIGAILPEWDGKHELLAPAKRFVNAMAVFTAPAQDVLDITCAEKVTLKGEVDFHQGYIRLRVGIRNCLTASVTGAEFKLVYNRDALRLEQVEPALRQKGDDIILGELGPDDKKQLAFYLDPQICTESYLEGILTFKDPSGKLETAKMPKKLTSVVCPILATDENINTAMLKKISDTELGHKDTKVFMLPAGLTPPKAFEVAKSAVQHHDVKLVREFDEPEPFIGEAWYYGKAKGRDDRLVVRARVLAAKNMLEFYVASSSTLMLTGMLAELKNDLKKEMDAIRGKAQAPMKQVTDQKQVDAMATFQSLLDKATELEKRAGKA